MQLNIYETDAGSVKAGYVCACGCTPAVCYQRGGELQKSVCCCGNEFVVGPDAVQSLRPRAGFRLETEERAAAWGEPITAAWLLGPSVHPEPAGTHADHGHGHDQGSGDEHGHDDDHDHGDAGGTVTDPVCGMSVEPAAALEKGLHRQLQGKDYYFCGKGCFLEFGDDPGRFLDPDYVPSM